MNPAPSCQESGCCCFEDISFLNISHVEFVWLQLNRSNRTPLDIQSESESYILSLEGYIHGKTRNTAPFIWQFCLQRQCALSYSINIHFIILFHHDASQYQLGWLHSIFNFYLGDLAVISKHGKLQQCQSCLPNGT